eukprot:gb/GFBE01082425.1/.p1 GENE.gb/GFBE01082425.1/~~gb/GFBE01082425.1/.p1  ORF type:complete len:560 (+),score=126.55 gb/GFBE01082425.1/:1-1680(+)
MAEAAQDFSVGSAVEIHSLQSEAGSKFNGCVGIVTQINADGRCAVKLQGSDSIPVVRPLNLRKASAAGGSCDTDNLDRAPVIEIVGLSSERGRLLNGMLGCSVGRPKSGERLLVKVFATGQKVSLKAANLQELRMDEVVVRAQRMLQEGQLYAVQCLLQGLPNAPKDLLKALSSRLSCGTHSEILGASLTLVDVPGKGKGYQAARDILAGEAIMFDTAFCSCLQGPQEYEVLERQCVGKSGAAADFLTEQVMSLKAGPSMLCMFDKSKLISILKNNVFKTIRDPEHVALFVAVSRFNHSCCANALADTSKSQAIVRAMRNIDRGEEVCISYVPVTETRAERQEQLIGKGFECICPRCEREKKEDLQFAVLCRCRKHSFSAQESAPSSQACPSCGQHFRKAESLAHMRAIEQINAFMRSPDAAAANPLDLIAKIEPLATKVESMSGENLAPSTHWQTLQLFNNLAGAHYFAATRVPGPHRDASFAAAFLYKKKVLDANAANHGGTPQRTVNYFQSLYRMLMGEFPTAEAKEACAKQMEELCLLHFGQTTLPAGVSSKVAR